MVATAKLFSMSRNLTLAELDPVDQRLVKKALAASAHAYAPYSGFAVGAALTTTAGKILVGANLENASYPVGICAELSAVSTANALGEWQITAIAVVGHKFTSPPDVSQIVTPCGRCRQVIFEAAQVSRHDILVLSCNALLTEIVISPISELLPRPFGPANLGLDEAWPGMKKGLGDIVSELLRHPTG
jgi:cytidine deaminase